MYNSRCFSKLVTETLYLLSKLLDEIVSQSYRYLGRLMIPFCLKYKNVEIHFYISILYNNLLYIHIHANPKVHINDILKIFRRW